ncbi:SAM-dependent methyltransferase [Tessaracoccus sp. Y1736]
MNAKIDVQDFSFDDPFVDDHLEQVTAEIEELSFMGFHGDARVDLARKRPGNIDRTNPATQALLSAVPASGAWLDMVPTAAALHPFYEPLAEDLPDGTPIGSRFRRWTRNCADARGIRSRAAALASILDAHADSRDWLSLACGAAQPVLQAAARRGALAPKVTLVDIDPRALRLADAYANTLGIADKVRLRRGNILHPRGLTGLLGLRLRRASFDVVDAIGILEYLKPHDWVYTYGRLIRTSSAMAGAVTFLRNAYDLVRPGGVLVVGNMLDTHPQLAFTLNVIQWPHIQPRSIDEMLHLLAAAGIDGPVTAKRPTDGVYCVYSVTKPVEDH